ncbi:MAG: hypothetical protein JSR36_17960 [Proteobacteria bacterium]|nr:hypothetical protein [Pseudomonadota bacterium]
MGFLTRTAVVSGLLLGLLAGCGSGQNPAATAGPVLKKKLAPSDPLAPYLVAAVASTKAGTPPIPVQVKFALKDHPQAGQPADLELVLTPTAGTLERLSGKVQGEEGLAVVAGETLPVTDKPLEGVPVHHTVQVTASKDGIYELTVEVVADAGGVPSAQSFSIPVVAGQGQADLSVGGTVSAPTVAGKAAPATPAPAH